MAVHCGTVTVLYFVTLCVGAVDNWAFYGSGLWHSYSAVLCDTVRWSCRKLDLLWQCSVAQLQCCNV